MTYRTFHVFALNAGVKTVLFGDKLATTVTNVPKPYVLIRFVTFHAVTCYFLLFVCVTPRYLR